MSDKQDRFIILKKVKYGEADLIIHALGSNGSKYSFMARSALKSKKRFGGGILEPLHYVNLSYKDNSDPNKIKTLNEAQLIDDFSSIRENYDRLELALFVASCVSHVGLEGDVNSDFLFNLMGHTLRAISQTEQVRLLRLHFCLKLLFQQGVISIENWMAPFLKTNMSDTQNLLKLEGWKDIVENYLDSIESMVLQYIKTADAGYT